MQKFSIVWMRRDLRLHDQAALFHALSQSPVPVVIVFIFDKNILDDLQDPEDKRINFIHQTLEGIKEKLQKLGSDLLIRYGKPLEVWKELIETYAIHALYFNRDYEPYAKERDAAVLHLLRLRKIGVFSYKDHLIFESNEVTKNNGDPYTVFTPYKSRWLLEFSSKSGEREIDGYLTQDFYNNLAQIEFDKIPSLAELGFKSTDFNFPDNKVKESLLASYDKTRDFPALAGTSRLGLHLRFGIISVRSLVNSAKEINDTFLSELIWREFYSHILDLYPQVVGHAFKPQYDRIQWINNEHDFQRWCEGKTGYPLVDAGMRELNAIGYMHNRVRMVTASFLTKHLLIDWRWGEAYFAHKLLDFDLASNNGGWQWAAGCGTDAAPYFRIFSPEAQQKKFDPDLEYIKNWVPEINTGDYPIPIVDHKVARARCLKTYKNALSGY
ncbi:MAG: deoxyribodipyrimidine photo-lyase [Saprospiraceae bacterium]|nr:deoxyribodipyrimidine photo-lyase [Saprospiraceae bacterium]